LIHFHKRFENNIHLSQFWFGSLWRKEIKKILK